MKMLSIYYNNENRNNYYYMRCKCYFILKNLIFYKKKEKI